MTEKIDDKREPPISYRPPAELREEFHRRVARSGLSTSAFITQAVFHTAPPRQSRRPSVEHREVVRLLASLARLHDQLHTIVLGGGNGVALDEALHQLREIRAACFIALGRKP